MNMKVLFVCNQNENRSKTAEELFGDEFETRSAGLYNEESLSEEELSWADLVVVMEEGQRKEIADRFPGSYMEKRIVCLDVPDIYSRGQVELKEELKEKMKSFQPSV